MMTMIKPGLVAAALLALAPTAQAQTAQIGNPAMVTERVSAGRQVIEIDMVALTDPAPRRAATGLVSAAPANAAAAPAPGPGPAMAEPAATANGTPPRKRYAHKVGLYEDAPLIALLGWTN